MNFSFSIPPKWQRTLLTFTLIFLFLAFLTNLKPREFKHHLQSHGYIPPPSSPKPWTYIPSRDRDNPNLSSAQCDAAFPDLYSEILRAQNIWRNKKLTRSSLIPPSSGGNDGFLRIRLLPSPSGRIDLRILQTRGLFRQDFRYRIHAVLQQLLRSVVHASASSPSPILSHPTEFAIVVDDFASPSASSALWSFTRNVADPLHDNLWLIPDYHFFAAPPEESEGFARMQDNARARDGPVKYKIPKVVWRGVEWTNPEIRGALLERTRGREWADVAAISWEKGEEGARMGMERFCDYAFAVNTEGRSWSARMLHILNCDSVPVVHDAFWVTHYYHLFVDGGNCVRVRRDFGDLEEKVWHYRNRTEAAQGIVERSINTFRERYTSPAAEGCYWRRLVGSWAETVGKMEEREERGISYEEFILHKNDEDYPYKPLPPSPPPPVQQSKLDDENGQELV